MDLKENHPVKFREIIEQFKDMASGGDGGCFFSSNSKFIVRKHYYKNWTDDDFNMILMELGIEK